MVFEFDPSHKSDTEGEVKEALVGDCEDDKGWRKGQKNDQETVEVVVSWLEAMQDWHCDGGNWWYVSPEVKTEKLCITYSL